MSIPTHTPVHDWVSDESVWGIVDQVWESLLQATAERSSGNLDGVPAQDLMSAVVEINGAWAGAVHVTCTASAAESIARIMLMLGGEEEASREDVEDALGEVVNVIGGNVKALVEPPTKLSLPSVQRGPAPGTGTIIRRVGTTWHGTHVEVVVTELGGHTEEQDRQTAPGEQQP